MRSNDLFLSWFCLAAAAICSVTSSQTAAVDLRHETPEVFNERLSAADFQTVSIGVGRQSGLRVEYVLVKVTLHHVSCASSSLLLC